MASITFLRRLASTSALALALGLAIGGGAMCPATAAERPPGGLPAAYGAIPVLPTQALPDSAAPNSAAIEAALSGDVGSPLLIGGRTLDRAALSALYAPRDYQPIWTEARRASFAAAVMAAESEGLDPLAYRVVTSRPVDRELLLTGAFLRYSAALARGRVPLQALETDWRIAPPAFDAGKVLEAALTGDVAGTLAALDPPSPDYAALKAALQKYRDLALHPWHPLRIAATIRPGDHNDLVPALRERLAAEGYIDAASIDSAGGNADPTLFDDRLSAAVARFQATHGLAIDGSAGRGTIAALNVSPAQRVREIEWNLERWRSLPRITAERRIEVNVPAALVTLYEGDRPVKIMRAIVGAAAHPTPVLRARLSSIVFNPPWKVPSSIIENEIRPALKRDPTYLERNDMAYVEVDGGRELEQLPGPKNSLGRIKFEMPNPDDIYLHDTPQRQLFEQSRRYFSHGCVRVEDPRGLAQILLDSREWSSDAIDAAIATGQTQSVPLPKSLPVYILYWTAFVDPDGTVEFRDDIYGRDRRLADALAALSAAEHMAQMAEARRS